MAGRQNLTRLLFFVFAASSSALLPLNGWMKTDGISWPNATSRATTFAGFRRGFASLRSSVVGGSAGPASKLTGKWKKVEEVGQEKAMLQLGLNIIFRKAATLLSRIEIKTTPTALEIVTKGSVVVSIREVYPFDGSISLCARRDKRSGRHRGKITWISENKVELDVAWDDPHGGVVTEIFQLDAKGRLVHTSNIKVNIDATTGRPGQPYTYYSVYARE